MWKTLPEPEAREPGHPAPWLLERLALEPEAAPAAALRHLAGCGACRASAGALEEERRSFLERRPAAPFLAALEARARAEEGRALQAAPRRWWPPRWLLVPAAAAAAAALLVLLPTKLTRDDGVRYKGDGAALHLFVARGGGPARPLEPGAPLRPGDLVRFGVTAPGPRHAFVASVDEAGRFSRYFPADGEAPLQETRALQLLPGSIVLDETTGQEWIALLLSDRPLDEGAVRDALLAAWRARQGERLGPLALDAESVVVPVRKVAP